MDIHSTAVVSRAPDLVWASESDLTLHQFCRLGRLAMIGGNSKIVQDCLPLVTTDGYPCRACGLNIVGLRRPGFKASELRKLKEAHRLLLRSGSSLHAALTSLEKLDDPLVSQLIDFIRNSSRGFCHEESAGRRQRAMVRGEQ